MRLPPEELASMWTRVFQGNNPSQDPFRPRLKERALFFPVRTPLLSEEHYAAVLAGARAVGDEWIIVSDSGAAAVLLNYTPRQDKLADDHWQVGVADGYGAYESITLLDDSTFCSPQGLWAVLVDHDSEHAQVAGNEPFMRAVRDHYPNTSEDLHAFVDYWKTRTYQYFVDGVVDSVRSR